MHDVVIDCARPASLARFWAQALDDHEIAPYDDEELIAVPALHLDAALVHLNRADAGGNGRGFVLRGGG